MLNDILFIRNLLHKHTDSNPDRFKVFFKTSKGYYAASDRFMGVSVPNLRKIAKYFKYLPLKLLQELLQSDINEERLLSLLILIQQYEEAVHTPTQERLYQFYVENLNHVNNWNLVDTSAHKMIGAHLWNKDKTPLLQWATSDILWERRIAIVATWDFIRRNDLEWTFKIARLLQKDRQDLIHKATGWMLREAGKRDERRLMNFLDQHAPTMPRTMLRYAIEKFSLENRQNYLSMKTLMKKSFLKNT